MIRICIHCIRIETDENPIIHRYVGHDAWHCRWSGSECVLIVPCLVLTCLTWCLPQLWQVCTTNMLLQQSNMLWRLFFPHGLPVGKWCNVSLKSLCNIVYIIWSRSRARHPHIPKERRGEQCILTHTIPYALGWRVGGPESLYTLHSHLVNWFDHRCPNFSATVSSFVHHWACLHCRSFLCKGGGSASSFWSNTFGRNNPDCQGPNNK